VERSPWVDAVFTSDSEHVVAAAANREVHHLFVWNRVHGKMEQILEGGCCVCVSV
jgi:hypothetical protein